MILLLLLEQCLHSMPNKLVQMLGPRMISTSQNDGNVSVHKFTPICVLELHSPFIMLCIVQELMGLCSCIHKVLLNNRASLDAENIMVLYSAMITKVW